MNARKLILITVGLLLVCQFASAQASGPNIQKLAISAAQTRSGLPVIPANTVAAGQARPYIWVAQQLSQGRNVGPLLQGLPSFCNVNNTAGGFNWCPNALQVAYGTNSILAGNGGKGMTIAIVDAYHYAHVKSDLDFFNAEMGQVPMDCVGNDPCFQDLDQNGGTNYCGSNTGWELETMLDVEWAHAMAPYANIILVEGCTNSFNDLATAVTTAVSLGADVVSNSYGANEFSGESTFDPAYITPVPILFSSGDNGAAGKGYPCASPYVTCVGGTRLMPVSTTDFHRGTETGWSGSGGGCSLPEEALPGYQSGNGVTICSTRAMPDISADADGNTGVIVYDSGNGGHFRVGGTSVACPLMAGMFADLDTARTTVVPTFLRKAKLAGSASASFVNNGLYLKYAGHNTGNPYVFYYFDILTGNNGFAAGPGYDLVTGLGVLSAPHAGPPWNLP
jgi:subtilase family serine protease